MSKNYRNNAVTAKGWEGMFLTPEAEKDNNEELKRSTKYLVHSECDFEHCVTYIGKKGEVVSTPRRVIWKKEGGTYNKTPVCPCNYMVRCRMPCRHIYAVATYLNIEIDYRDYMGDEHLASTYRDCHPTEEGIHRVFHSELVNIPDAMIQPDFITLPGRNKMKRNDIFDKRGKKRVRCSSCHELGHNKRSCKATKRARYSHGINSKAELEAMTITIMMTHFTDNIVEDM